MTDARFSRRLFCLAALAGTATPALAQQVSRTRSFDIFRDGSNIGEHVVQVEAVDGGLRATTHIDIAVKVLGFTAYRYGMDYQESYDGQGRLTGLSGTANDDGKRGHVEVSRVGNALEIDGSSYSGEAPGLAMPTSYWRPSSLDRTPWISTQTGLLLPVTVSPTDAGEAPAGASGYRVSDGDEFVVDLFYDARGEWVGTAFDAGGERAVYRLREDTGALNI